ncbi:hypothetical protein FE394_18950, partial [Xenorhabdus sp. Reich]
MSSYISKVIVFFTVIYSLLIPSTMMNAFAEGHLTTNKIDNKENIDFNVNGSSKRFLNSNANKENDLNKNNESSESGTPNVIASNIQTVS